MPSPRPLVLFAALAACDSSDGGGPAAGTCHLEGEPISLPTSRYFGLAAQGDDFILVTSATAALEARVITANEVGAPEAIGIAPGPVALATRGDEVLAQTFSLGWGTPRLARFDGASWTVKGGEPLELGVIRRSGTIAANANETVAFWTEGGGTTKLYQAAWGDNSFGTPEEVLGDVSDLAGDTLHAAFDGAGRLHIATYGTVGGQSGLVRAVRDNGTWGATTFVGDVPDYVQNAVTTAMTADSGGAIWFAELHGADFFEELKAGLTFWRDDGTALKRVARVNDDRLVAQGLDLAALSDGRVVATASWGQNNLDAASSNDSVTLTLCSASGCARAATLDGRKGVFYGATKVAATGTRGIAAWDWEEKGSSEETGLTLQRFRCDPPQ